MKSFTERLQDCRLFHSSESVTDTVSCLATALRAMGFSVDLAERGMVRARKGSEWRTRLRGAHGVAAEHLPVRFEAEATESEGGTRVRTTLSDDWGWGLRTGAERAYFPYFRLLLTELTQRGSLRELSPERPIGQMFADGTPAQEMQSRWKAYAVLAGILAVLLLASFFVESALLAIWTSLFG
jgi:hypothetical protein